MLGIPLLTQAVIALRNHFEEVTEELGGDIVPDELSALEVVKSGNPAFLQIHQPGRVGAARANLYPFAQHGAHAAVLLAEGQPELEDIGGPRALLGAAIPYLTIEIGSAGISTYPDHLQSVQAFEILDADFSAGRLDPPRSPSTAM